MKLKKLLFSVAALAALTIATPSWAETELSVQRFFGACEADFGTNTDVDKAVGECGIITSLINKFNAENSDINVVVTTVEWPGYDQLTAQLAAGDPPDIVTMHESVISDYQSRNLLMPMDDIFKSAGIEPSSFTGAGVAGVTKDGKMYGMPFDTWTMLFHINLNLFKQADMLNADGTPMLPSSPDELLEQARKFKAATGKPYMIQQLANGVAPYTRLFYTFMAQQNSDFFADPMNVKLQSDEARNVVNLFKTIFDEGLTTIDMDYPSAVAAFPGGEGGVALNGTWLIGDYVAASEKEGALKDGYTVYPYPQLFATDASYADGHAWVMPTKERSDENIAATAKFLRFLTDNDYQWARTGHLPGVQAVFDMEDFKNLPHRSNIAKIAQTGVSLPPAVLRQFAVQDIIGEEISSAITGNKSVDDALKDAEYRVNDLLNNL
ncbi:MAG: extracellular solute-binding protein [Alphaproteobacteria bacterium]|nr:extracellular solute-binding protein [Alphaproteobacteria bacterium]